MLEYCLSFTAAYTALEDFCGVWAQENNLELWLPSSWCSLMEWEGICSSQAKAAQDRVFCLRIIHGTSGILSSLGFNSQLWGLTLLGVVEMSRMSCLLSFIDFYKTWKVLGTWLKFSVWFKCLPECFCPFPISQSVKTCTELWQSHGGGARREADKLGITQELLGSTDKVNICLRGSLKAPNQRNAAGLLLALGDEKHRKLQLKLI